MKKVVTILSLVIVLATSIVVGTLAKYQAGDAIEQTGVVISKSFDVKLNSSAAFDETVAIAPGEIVEKAFEMEYDFGVKAQVGMTIVLGEADGMSMIAPLSIAVLDKDGNEIAPVYTATDEHGCKTWQTTLLADGKGTDIFKIVVKWSETEKDSDYISSAEKKFGSKLSVNVGATQIV